MHTGSGHLALSSSASAEGPSFLPEEGPRLLGVAHSCQDRVHVILVWEAPSCSARSKRWFTPRVRFEPSTYPVGKPLFSTTSHSWGTEVHAAVRLSAETEAPGSRGQKVISRTGLQMGMQLLVLTEPQFPSLCLVPSPAILRCRKPSGGAWHLGSILLQHRHHPHE